MRKYGIISGIILILVVVSELNSTEILNELSRPKRQFKSYDGQDYSEQRYDQPQVIPQPGPAPGNTFTKENVNYSNNNTENYNRETVCEGPNCKNQPPQAPPTRTTPQKNCPGDSCPTPNNQPTGCPNGNCNQNNNPPRGGGCSRSDNSCGNDRTNTCRGRDCDQGDRTGAPPRSTGNDDNHGCPLPMFLERSRPCCRSFSNERFSEQITIYKRECIDDLPQRDCGESDSCLKSCVARKQGLLTRSGTIDRNEAKWVVKNEYVESNWAADVSDCVVETCIVRANRRGNECSIVNTFFDCLSQEFELECPNNMMIGGRSCNNDAPGRGSPGRNRDTNRGDDYPRGRGNDGDVSYPRGGEDYPRRGESYPRGGDGYPRGGQGYPRGGDGYPRGGEEYPRGGEMYPRGGMYTRGGVTESRFGYDDGPVGPGRGGYVERGFYDSGERYRGKKGRRRGSGSGSGSDSGSDSNSGSHEHRRDRGGRHYYYSQHRYRRDILNLFSKPNQLAK